MNRLPLETFSSVLVLAEEETEGNTLHADSNSLATLLLVRDLQTERKTESNKLNKPQEEGGAGEDEDKPIADSGGRRRASSYARHAPSVYSADYQGMGC